LTQDLLSDPSETRVELPSPDWGASRVGDYMTKDSETLRPDDRVVWPLHRVSLFAPPTVRLAPGTGVSIR